MTITNISDINLPVELERGLQIYQSWSDGTVTAEQALEDLTVIYDGQKSQADTLETVTGAIRVWLEEIVSYAGQKMQAAGYQIEITPASVSYTYDRKQLNDLCNRLRKEGKGDVATDIEACLKSTERKASLRMTKIK